MSAVALSGIVPNLPEAEYFASPALSSTGARKLLDSPARFRYYMDHPQPHKTAFDLGSAVHSKVLGTGYPVVSLDFDSFRSKDAQVARDEAYALGQIPMLTKDLTEVNDMAEAVLSHPVAKVLFEQPGQSEASVFATDPETGVPLRARFDFLPDLDGKRPVAVDLKTTGKSASVDEFSKTVANFGYDVQDAHYDYTLDLVTGVEIPLVFVVVETLPPYLVAVHQLPIVWREMGQKKAQRARELFAECTATGIWPGYPQEVQLLTQPTWALYQDEERFA